jgi:hypothetical protein
VICALDQLRRESSLPQLPFLAEAARSIRRGRAWRCRRVSPRSAPGIRSCHAGWERANWQCLSAGPAGSALWPVGGTMMTRSDACGCKDDDHLGYCAWHADAERRHKAGQKQVWCSICGKWRWPNQVGPGARTMTYKQFNVHLRQRERADARARQTGQPIGA